MRGGEGPAFMPVGVKFLRDFLPLYPPKAFQGSLYFGGKGGRAQRLAMT